jgi:hypothetical protein
MPAAAKFRQAFHASNGRASTFGLSCRGFQRRKCLTKQQISLRMKTRARADQRITVAFINLMSGSKTMRAATTAIAIAGLSAAISGTMASDKPAFSLKILWSAPTTTVPSNSDAWRRTSSGFLIVAQTIAPDGRIIFLGDQITARGHSPALLSDAEQNQPDSATILKLRGAGPPRDEGFLSKLFEGNAVNRMPYLSTLALGPSGDVWIGGRSNTYRDIASAAHSDAYLARIGEIGKPLWEMAYGKGGERNISSITAMSGGDVAVAGPGGRNGWLARIGSDGKQIWERNFGNDLGSAVASLSNDQLVVVGFGSTGSIQTRDYQVHVTVWIVDGSGTLLAETQIRNSITTSYNHYFGKIAVTATGDAIYVASSWQGFFDAQPVEVSKLGIDGKLVWSNRLTDTVVGVDGAVRSWKNCSPTLAIMPHGDALVACALDGRIHLYELEQSSGAYRESYLPLPDCRINPAALFLAVRPDGVIILSGSQPNVNVGPGCTWIGRLTAVR